jgi:hypothetical protein
METVIVNKTAYVTSLALEDETQNVDFFETGFTSSVQ